MRLIAERHENNYSYKIFVNNWNEYTVKYSFKGKEISGADYFTDNEKDAIKTAKKQLNYFIEEDLCKGA